MKQGVEVASAGTRANHLQLTPDNHTSSSSLKFFYSLNALLDAKETRYIWVTEGHLKCYHIT